MAESRELVLCDVLCFLVNKFVSIGAKQLKSILADFYSSEDLNEAKVRLLDDIEVLNNLSSLLICHGVGKAIAKSRVRLTI